MSLSITSLANTPGPSGPSIAMRIDSGTRIQRYPVTQAAAISLKPTPVPSGAERAVDRRV